VKLGPAETLAAGKLWQWFGLEHAGEVLGRFRLPAAECVDLVHVVQQNASTRRKQGVEIWLDRQGKKIQPKQVNAMQARGEAPAATKTVPRVITAGRVPLSVTLRRRDDGKWYLLASFPRNDLPGAIAQPTAWMGVDLNADSVAHAVMQMVAGEPVLLSYRKDTFSLSDSKAHRTERLYRIVNALVGDAKQNGWGVSLEYLDFEHCKSWLKTKLGALLHLFPYRKIRRIFERRCLEAGVPLRYVKPEYSSLLGAVLCVRWPALGRDQAAGAVLALRASEEGNPWLEKTCERTALASPVSLRLNAKGRFGHTLAICGATVAARQLDSASVPFAPSPALRWQRGCGRRIRAALSTLSDLYVDSLRERGRGAAPQKPPPPVFKMPRILSVDLRLHSRRSTLSMPA
jgi:IS605 OrfB family transposase